MIRIKDSATYVLVIRTCDTASWLKTITFILNVIRNDDLLHVRSDDHDNYSNIHLHVLGSNLLDIYSNL